VALAALLRSSGLRPDFLLGESVGEVAAAYLAGVFSLADACRLVVARAAGTELPEITFSEPSVPMVSAATGELIERGPDYWSRPAGKPDGLADGVRLLRTRGVTGFLVLGPDDTLDVVRDTVAEVDDRGWVTAVLPRGDGDAAPVLGFLAEAYVNGAPVDWTAVLAGAGRRRAGLPTYPFQRRRFWPAFASAHPLLGAAVELADPVQRWFGRPDGTPVLSAGARVDWAVAAARAVDAPTALRDLVFPEPRTRSVGPAAVQTVVRNGVLPMRIDGYARSSGAGWTAYLGAEIAEPEPAAGFPDRADGDLIHVTAGSAAEVLDGCLRLAADGGSVAAAERLELFDEVPAEVWCRVRPNPTDRDLTDLDLVSADGTPVARITGLRSHQ
jgi:hypothetical protein